ncbi:MAG: DUF1553 domain-containing protein [Planctomycetaceae bacterium]
MMYKSAVLSLVTLWIVAAAAGSDVERVAFFEQKIRPVLVKHCYACHSSDAETLKGNLLLDSKAGWERGGDSGEAVIVPGDPEASLLVRSIRHQEGGLEMPPDAPKLSNGEIADIVAWIEQGAADPRQAAVVDVKRADKSWWSLQPLAKIAEVEPPDAIDRLVAAKLAESGLALNPPADARSLIRRMSYDMLGLPPQPEEVEQFVSAFAVDPRAATESLVDRLLASPRYGERWGRHWLDVVRFGESNGFERNVIIDDLWPFRDYVIRSLNEDKPFNQFMVEHLAGDVIGKGDPDVEIGTAFLVAGPYDDVGNQDVVAQKNIRAATLDDVITATASAFLGLTVHCARCHHHKFDPIPTEDYYRMRAAFEGVTHGRRVMATPEQRETFEAAVKPLRKQIAELTAKRDAIDQAIDDRAKAALADFKATRPKIDVHGTTESFAPVEARYVKFVIHALTSSYQSPAAKRSKAAGSGRLTEFEVWSSGANARNVALAANGAIAAGAKSATAEDFPEAYGAQLCIDGQLGEQWFIGQPAELLVTLKQPEVVDRIKFINSKGGREIDESKVRGATPCEYEVQVSMDGESWKTVASDEGREPWSEQHGIERERQRILTTEETRQLNELGQQIASRQRALAAVAPLPQAWAGVFDQPAVPTFVHRGGDPMQEVAPISPASLAVLSHVVKPYELAAAAPEGERRLALAKWITRDDNPLTLRVLANRVWQYHFGVGIVDTPSDFGFLGGLPTHPELLDYLASRLRSSGWRLKPLHREILLSKTYLQSAEVREEAAQKDRGSRLLGRYPPRRLSAEELRDTLLQVAGKLRLEPAGGPGFRLYKFTQNNVCTYFPLDQHGPETYRRAVYHQNARASVVEVLTDFDLPDNAFAAPKRANTTTPLQALTLLNHRFVIDMGDAFAARLIGEDPIVVAFSFAFQREPSSSEREASQKLIDAYGLPAFCRALLNANEVLYLD